MAPFFDKYIIVPTAPAIRDHDDIGNQKCKKECVVPSSLKEGRNKDRKVVFSERRSEHRQMKAVFPVGYHMIIS